MFKVPGAHSAEVENHIEHNRDKYQSLLQASHGRKDLTNDTIFTIDPPGCKDVDDAFSVHENEDGTYAVGVHIADVSCFVSDGDLVDQNAEARACSFYAADKDISSPMLPTTLSHNLCSLLPGQTRCAISVFFYFTKDGEEVASAEIKKTLIRSSASLTYEDTQRCISSQKSSQVDSAICEKILTLHMLAQKMRQNRLEQSQYFVEMHHLEDEDIDAHILVEEFMLRTNGTVAKFLLATYPECIPLRKKDSPSPESITAWCSNCLTTAPLSFYFRRFEKILMERNGTTPKPALKDIPLLKDVVEQISLALKQKKLDRVQQFVGSESFHPLHAIALHKWLGIQNPASFVASNGSDPTVHFALQLAAYTQFTSPIRRYMDIVVHRMVSAALAYEPNPYTAERLQKLCSHVNTVYSRAKRHSKAIEHLKKTCELMENSLYTPGIVSEVTDGHLQLILPYLPYQRAWERAVCYTHLNVAVKPEISEDGEANLQWQKRIYDATGFHPLAKTKATMNEPLVLNPNTNVGNVPVGIWQMLQQAISDRDEHKLAVLSDKVVTMCKAQERMQELTSEMKDVRIVKHHVPFSWKFRPGSAVQVQMVAECPMGLIQPAIRLLNFTPEYDMCIQHVKNPVSCFADIVTNHLKNSYRDIQDYQNILLPIMKMEAACNAVADADSVVISNAQVTLHLSNSKYYGQFKVSKSYCKLRLINLLKNSKDEESQVHDFMCLRFPFDDDTGTKQTWVGHAERTRAHLNNEGEIVVEFGIHHMNEKPPKVITKGSTLCHIQLIFKTLPDRYIS